MSKLPLNFPVFYHCAVKGKTNLTQYNAVSMLLLGKYRNPDDLLSVDSDHYPPEISDADAANYISGKKGIKKEVLVEALEITAEEAEKRLRKLGFQDITGINEALRRLMDMMDISSDIYSQLSDAYDAGELTLAANMFLMAIRYPSRQLVPLSASDKRKIASCFSRRTKSPGENAASTESGGELTPEEIDALLQAAGFPDPEEAPENAEKKVVSAHKIPYEDHIITCPFHISALTASAFSELTNIILSGGLTALSNLFDEIVHAGLPEFGYYANFEILNSLLFNDDRVRIVFKLFRDDPSDLPNARPQITHGYIVLSADAAAFDDYYERHRQIHPTKFIMYNESVEYESSMYREIGSIFCGTGATALSDLLSGERIRIEEANISHLKHTLEEKGPIFAGALPFQLTNSSGRAFLLLNCGSAQTLLDSQKEYL